MEYYDGGNIRQSQGQIIPPVKLKFLFPNNTVFYLRYAFQIFVFGESIVPSVWLHSPIRTAKIAEYLLRNDSAWTKDKIVTAMNAGKEKYVTLKTPLPVFITYFTTWVDGSGKINFRNDVYGRTAASRDACVQEITVLLHSIDCIYFHYFYTFYRRIFDCIASSALSICFSVTNH